MSLNAWLDENGCHLPKLQKPLEDVDPFINGDSCSSSCSKTVSLDDAVYTGEDNLILFFLKLLRHGFSYLMRMTLLFCTSMLS